MPRASDLAELRWTDLAAGAAPVVAVPLGSCEQHGPHLPLDTDTRIAMALSERLAAQRDDVVVAPPITVSASGEHDGFPGTLSIGTAATTTVVVELVRSADWARGVVIVNGHGGNFEAVTEAIARLDGEGRPVSAFWPRVAGGDLHAGRTETSIMLALAPGSVDLAAAAAGPQPTVDELRSSGVRAWSTNGVLGNPGDASVDHGLELLDRLHHQLIEHVDATWPR